MIARIEAWFLRRTGWMNGARVQAWLPFGVILACGLLSLALGQDDNWDFKNYHWYNAYAFLHGRLGVDISPAQWQSYFNPTIDLPYYLLNQVLPAPAVGFLYGALHGCNVMLLLAIARALLQAASPRLIGLLALAGIGGAGFLSELGNTMGDNLTALFVLSALRLVLVRGLALRPLLLAGLLIGLGTGLKLTNATYALALCLSVLALDGGVRQRVLGAFGFGLATAAGLLLSAGHWWWTMWRQFGNPLFPQFNNVFHSPLALESGVLDAEHLPRNLLETLFYPYVFSADFLRVSELALRQWMWPLTYTLLLACAVQALLHRGPRLAERPRVLIVFFVLAYCAWLKLFGIYRYLIPLELLSPLLVWLLCAQLFPARVAPRLAAWMLMVCALVVLPFHTWGHTAWAREVLAADLPELKEPQETLVLTVHGHPPMGWLATTWPQAVRVLSIHSGFPETAAYRARIASIIASRHGPVYVMLAAPVDEKQASVERKLVTAERLGLTAGARGCATLSWLASHFRLQADYQPLDGERCTLRLPAALRTDPGPEWTARLTQARTEIAPYGLQLQDRCAIRPATMGAEAYPILLCEARRTP